MLKRFSYAILSLYLCANFIPLYYVNKTLKSYHKEILDIVKQYCKPNQYFNPHRQLIYFETLKDDAVGVCMMNNFSYIIKIDPKNWAISNEDERFEIITHEMAHCLLKKQHVDNSKNYMYYSIAQLNKEIVKEQFITDLEAYCGKR